jgi:hypothetical protein
MRQRKKEEDRERLRQLEEAVMKTKVAHKALEREKALKATMNEKIRKAMEEVVSSCL